ncbi:hypothetical protein Q7L71_06810 [Conexibacter sp. CPCC 205706]|nr:MULTISPECIES: hypothetical protein [unclassified Conexibacter]MDO8185282.1 hypothetical protein [Conexibacter sp. CPCC 205706]MDO8198328.1 hypothetical protein [Conexibacter sp. CPCC 205762]
MTRRRRRLRDELTPRRRRVETATAAALRAQRRQLSSSPARPASTAPLDRAVRELRALARDLDRRAGRDAQVRAAARGVAELARAYAALAAAERTAAPQAAADQTTKAVAALRTAERLQRKAGDAWPL